MTRSSMPRPAHASLPGARFVVRRLAWVAAPLVALALLGGCPGNEAATPSDAGLEAAPDAPSDCPAGFLGDPTKDPVIELRALRADGTDVPIVDGDDLAIVFPPQGGRVAFVGVRALNLDGCGVQVTGALRDLGSRQVRLDGRTLNLQKQADGWGTTGTGTSANLEDSAAIGDYSNIPSCPNQWADVDVFDQPFELEVIVQDRRKKKASKVIRVTPRCAEPGAKEAACRCLCKHGYQLGQVCGDDAGTDGGP
jgi:hypothetical protein